MRWNPFRRGTSSDSTRSNDALTAAATAVKASSASIVPQYESWQNEAWAYYDSLGEFRFSVDWKAEMMSRIRLHAAQIEPGRDEPEIIEDGRAPTIVNELGGQLNHQPHLLNSIETQLSVVGDSYLVGETLSDGNSWSIKSADEIRLKAGKYEIIDEQSSSGTTVHWRQLKPDSMVVRIWRPHKRYHYMADSVTRTMRSTMRELDLVNRKIQAKYLSRLASAGILVMPDEVNFPVREEFAEANDPFVQEWIETARQAIQNPGTASAAVPIPMRVPAEYSDSFNFLSFADGDDGDGDINKRESAIKRLATQIDVPPEILLGMSDANHWTAWQIEESAVKAHISSDAETIVNALTVGYLHPRLKAEGIDPTNVVVWYDASELTARPDNSKNALDAYDRLELSPTSFRRELGFDDNDAPTNDETRTMALRALSKFVTTGFVSLAELTNDDSLINRAAQQGNVEDLPINVDGEPVENTNEDDDDGGGEGSGNQGNDESRSDRGEPNTRQDPPPTLGVDVATQASASHRVQFTMDSFTMYHPWCCDGATISCPVAQASRRLRWYPGTVGMYDTWLSPSGELIIGKRTFDTNDNYIRGHSRRLNRKAVSNGTGTGS